MVWLWHPHMTTEETIALNKWTFVGKVMSLVFSMLSRFVIDCCLDMLLFFQGASVFFFFFNFIFKLYITVLVLPNIKMNPPQVYMCSPSWTFLPPPSPFHPSGSSQQVSFNFMAAVIICRDFGAQENQVCQCFQCHCVNSNQCWHLAMFIVWEPETVCK